MTCEAPASSTPGTRRFLARWRSGRRHRETSRKAGWLVLAVFICVVLLFPIYWMVLSSLEPTADLLTRQLSLIPAPGKLAPSIYGSTFHQYAVVSWLLNTTLVTLGAVVLSMLVSVPAGYSLSRLRSGSGAAGALLLLTRVMPGTLLAIPFFVMLQEVRLLNTLWALILADTSIIVPFAAWIMKGFFDAVPHDLEEAARVDGCGLFGAFRRVVLPLVKPGIGATAIYSVILAWSDYLFSKTLLLDPTHWTLTVGAVSLIGEETVNWNGLMAIGVIAAAPMLLAFIVLEPYLVSGMTAGAVVG